MSYSSIQVLTLIFEKKGANVHVFSQMFWNTSDEGFPLIVIISLCSYGVFNCFSDKITKIYSNDTMNCMISLFRIHI